MSEQYDLYRGFPPHVRHSDTSIAAAASQLGTANSKRAVVYRLIRQSGATGRTDDELEQETGWRHQTVSARRRELVLKKLVEDSGNRRNTTSGRKAVVWVAVDQGLTNRPRCG
jgi:hypothetical protein